MLTKKENEVENFEIRKLGEEYFAEMKNFFRDVFMCEPWCDDWSDDAQLTAYIKDLACCFNSISYGFFDGEKMVALAIGNKRHWWGGTEYFIEEFCVKTELQGQGIGSKFMAAIETEIVKNGMNQIYLQTERGKPAYNFYKKQGFKEIDDHVGFFKEMIV